LYWSPPGVCREPDFYGILVNLLGFEGISPTLGFDLDPGRDMAAYDIEDQKAAALYKLLEHLFA